MATGKVEKIFDAQSLSDTDTWTLSPWINILGYAKVLIFLKNNDSSNTMQYKIDARADIDDSDSEYALKTATDLTAGSSIYETLSDAWEGIRIGIRRKTSGETISSVDGFVTRKRR